MDKEFLELPTRNGPMYIIPDLITAVVPYYDPKSCTVYFGGTNGILCTLPSAKVRAMIQDFKPTEESTEEFLEGNTKE